ncbi:unnamed protein product [Vitrella brassicaformis CCMP3155]|uniref:40S ribosomal protein S4 n=2 Tax=Vitrella brassicaformis TaxID=1169539 RepID=A0A0G4FNE4_VITBC|nr:unnamed protein product [Vitrella brassicaformis CCMP3155]|eukprot:CEM15726.1 unnamed protein product [Vitrella brassicaformis CCMP3155]
MARGPKKHMKRVASPYHWMLDKMTGVYAPRPSTGPHKLRECLPLIILLRNKLKYALTYSEAKYICMQRAIKVDGKVRTDMGFPVGFQDTVTIDKTKQNFKMMLDPKGRYRCVSVSPSEAAKKLCRVVKVYLGPNGVPCATTHDGRTIRYVHPDVKVHDTLHIDISPEGKGVLDFIKFEVGNVCMCTGGHNIGRVGTIVSREKHPGAYEIVKVKDAKGHQFATRLANVFCIGKGTKPWCTLPKDKGIRLSIKEDREKRLQKQGSLM